MRTSDLHLALQQASRLFDFAADCSPAEFLHETFGIVRGMFSFDAFDWKVARNCRKRYEIESWYGVGVPASVYQDWPRYRHRQKAREQLFSAPTRSLVWIPERDEPDEDIKEAYYRPISMNSFAASQSTTAADRSNILAIVRFGKQPHLRQSDADLLGVMAPHMLCALQHVWLRQRYEESINAETACAYALIDEFGLIHQSEESFADLLQLEWPDWFGPQLPVFLRHLLSTQNEHYLGAQVAVCIQRNGGAIDLWIRKRRLCDCLTDRERRIAELYAGGMHYKEIARTVDLAPSTIRTRLSMIYLKLNVTTKVGLSSVLNDGKRTKSGDNPRKAGLRQSA
jgi:DNA-binding CsgD family transcriptional regulator